jgi:hypothetical protein
METKEKSAPFRVIPKSSLIEPGDQVITPDLAFRIIDQTQFDGQRKVFDHHVRLLGDIMLSGDWISGDQITFCRTPDGKLYLVNGYHRLSALIQYNTVQVFNVRIVDVNCVEEVRKVYVTFDGASTRKRSEGEILDAMDIVKGYGITKQVATAVFRAAPLLFSNLQYRNYQKAPEYVSNIAKRLEKSREFWLYGKKYQGFIEGSTYKHKLKLLTQGVSAVALATIRHRPAIAEAFWPAVATMSNLDNDDPRMTLAKTLDSRSYNTKHPKDGEVPNIVIDCSLAWNAFYDGRNLSHIQTGNVKRFKLAGTLWG